MATKMNMILSIIWTCCWIQIISGNPAEIMRQSNKFGPPLSADELNCIPTFNKSESNPALNHRCIQHDNKNAYPALKWPKPFQVPYDIDSTFTARERCVIGHAMKKYHNHTCIRFVPRNGESDFIQINKLNITGWDCNSLGSGYIDGSGAHTVNFSPQCFEIEPATAMHELMHRLGFDHEQERPDRDNYITVIYENIPADWRPQYEIAAGSTALLQYDYSSVMHYPLVDRMKTKKNTRGVEVGQHRGLSKLDIMKLNLMYCKI
uniref:Metalloendopeptidase n=1 Tax=Daphnia galeata TaxID=27404 RepID=A0A8J2RE35_9CRUS|nr:unnamed protein product [Daphnia galeata]